MLRSLQFASPKPCQTFPTQHFDDVAHETHDPFSHDVAQTMASLWAPHRPHHIEPLAMSHGGMAPYKIVIDGTPYFGKALMQKADCQTDNRAHVKREAALASLAHRTCGVAPAVQFVHPQGLGFMTDFLPASTVSRDAARSLAQPAIFKSIAQVHTSADDPLLHRENSPWLHGINIAEQLAAANVSRHIADKHVALQTALDKAVLKLPAKPVPCHNDLKIRNIIYDEQADTAHLIDWFGFSRNDAAEDLAYYACSVDCRPRHLQPLLRAYARHIDDLEALHGPRFEDRITLHLGGNFNRKFSYFSNQDDPEGLSAYYMAHLAEHAVNMAPLLRDLAGIALKFEAPLTGV